MGYITELNTLIGLPRGFDIKQLHPDGVYKIILDRERAFPLHIAMIVITKEWDFLGYAVAEKAENIGGKCKLTFKVLTLFPESERVIYKNNFIAAGKLTGEIK
jgi:hypothetical protein